MVKEKRAVIYARISLDKTGEGASLDRQVETCRHLIMSRSWNEVGVLRETQSAYAKKRRPEWDRVLEMVRNDEVDVIVAYQLDRVTRSLRDLTELIDLTRTFDVGLVTAQGDLDLTNETGKMLAGILTNVAEFEVERKSTRQKLANRDNAAKGEFWHGGFRAFGFEKDGSHVTNEADAIRAAARDVLSGVPLKEIARRWEREGLQSTRTGEARWRLQSVRAILLNPKNAGLRAYRGEVVGPGKWDPILDGATYTSLKAFLTDPGRRVGGNPGGKTPLNLLSGIATCVVCGEDVRAGSSRGVKVYSCVRGCISTERSTADAVVRDGIAAMFRAFGKAPILGSDTSVDVEVGLALDERDAVLGRRTVLSRAFAHGRIGDAEYELALEEINRELSRLEAAALAATAVGTFGSINSDGPEFAKQFLDGGLHEQRSVITACAVVALRPKGRGRRNVPIEDQVDLHVNHSGEWINAITLDR